MGKVKSYLCSQPVILLVDIPPPPGLAFLALQPQLLALAQLLHLAVMAFVAQRRCRGQEERPGDHGEDERKAEEEEWVPGHLGAVRGRETVLQGEGDGGGRLILAGGERWHDDDGIGVL